MTTETFVNCDLCDILSPKMVSYRRSSYTLSSSGNHKRCDDETEVTCDETVPDLNESCSSVPTLSSHHIRSTSLHCRWRGSSDLCELSERNEQICEDSFACDITDDSFAHNINEWNVLRLLGEGAFGQVAQVRLKSYHEQPGRCYALKILSKYQILRDGQVDDVIREKKLLQEASAHPFIVKLWASWQDTNLIYLLQDFVQGGELYSLMLQSDCDNCSVESDRSQIRRPLTNDHAQFYTACITDALQYLHRICNIVYRDLKPENVLIDSRGYPVLIDFGLAKRLTHDSEYQTRTLCGTPRYVSPEQIQGFKYSFEVDYWALGVLVYEMLTGLHPFDDWDGCNDIELYNSVTSDEYRSFPSDNTTISEDAKDFVDGLLNKDPSSRLGSADQNVSIQDHRWISSIHQSELRERSIQAPWIPELTCDEDAGMFEDWTASSRPSESYLNQRNYNSLTSKEQERFTSFDDA